MVWDHATQAKQVKLCIRCERRAKGLCICGQERAEGRSRCIDCLASMRDYKRSLRADAAERDAKRKRKAEQDAAVEAMVEQRAREAWL